MMRDVQCFVNVAELDHSRQSFFVANSECFVRRIRPEFSLNEPVHVDLLHATRRWSALFKKI